MLILEPFRRGIDSLQRVLDIPKSDVSRDAAIQRFEYTYELAWKFMQRSLSLHLNQPLAGLPRRELFRIARDNRLVTYADQWMGFHEARNLTSQVYNEDIAEKVFETAACFLNAAQDLYARLEARND